LVSLRISALALEDLKNIGRYTQKRWGSEKRNNYLSQLNEGFKKLLSNPQMGRCYDEIIQGYRRFCEGEHIIFYRITEQTLDVIRILHKNTDIENHI
jgi:toxin ParE1/3/4